MHSPLVTPHYEAKRFLPIYQAMEPSKERSVSFWYKKIGGSLVFRVLHLSWWEIGVSVWSVVEPLTVEFNIEIPIEISKPKKLNKSSKSKAISTLPREAVIKEVSHLAIHEKLEVDEISKRLGVSLSTVRRVCRTHKIGNYSASQKAIVSRTSQAPFGWDVAQGRLQQNQKEWEWVLEIHRLRKLGTSLHQIANTLTSQNVATKNGGRWFAKTVSQILNFNSQHLSNSTNNRRKHGDR